MSTDILNITCTIHLSVPSFNVFKTKLNEKQTNEKNLSPLCSPWALLCLFLGTTIYPSQKCVNVSLSVLSICIASLWLHFLFSYSESLLLLQSHLLPRRKLLFPLLTTLRTPNMWGLFLHQPIFPLSDTNPVSWNSVLTLTTGSSYRPCRLRA